MEVGQQIVVSTGVTMHDGVKYLSILGIGEYLGEMMPEGKHPLHPKERHEQPRFPQPMVKIGEETITNWQGTFFTLDQFEVIVGNNLHMPVKQFPITITAEVE
ncbi:hypothetical protein L9H26_19045 [Morganella psychrotolerans]|uniref:Uncharacterized protein n=1 Tax=Morganella psychrotolerans TaxID=368603 RepID=A0A5M9QYB8_9GAMM|nr:hypothetical protein [Morganella psychrotolerans]KAA8712999.1 hypothetical protein F4V73_17945 [Morganella psychrotolerans]OBU01900.1 hypothetical protein AYY16_16965 [Morganella psychrotolerans]